MTTTPRPWSLDCLEPIPFEPIPNDHAKWEICTISGADTPGIIATKVRIENAALIVRAVNAYDTLTAENTALRALLARTLDSPKNTWGIEVEDALAGKEIT